MLIQNYQDTWSEHFNAIKKIIQKSLTGLNIAIEHTGSTAVPTLASKPIIDIDIVFARNIAFEEIRIRLEKMGYYHNGSQGIPDREVFRRNAIGHKHNVLDFIDHHLYVPNEKSRMEKTYLVSRLSYSQ
jgi:GrpB-like predicted nucleotidyltransferase (UPF0157 family)